MSISTDLNSQEHSGLDPVIFFRLYIAGNAANSQRAISNLTAICQKYLPDRHEIEIVDMMQETQRAVADGVLVTPTLIKLAPLPKWSIIGDLSAKQRVLLALGIEDNS